MISSKLRHVVIAIVAIGLLGACQGLPQLSRPLPARMLNQSEWTTIEVFAAGGWRDTGIEVKPSDVLELSAAGRWSMGLLCGRTDADGTGVSPLCAGDPWRIGATGSTLIGRIGEDGKPFRVGSKLALTATTGGHLYLRAYDLVPVDNSGSMMVTVSLVGAADRPAVAGAPRSQPPGTKGPTRPPQNATGTAESGAGVAQPRLQAARGIYALERRVDFNVLDAVSFDPVTRQVTLVGHYEERYAGRRIPYLQHLSVLLASPAPEVSLDWTPDSERRVERFLRRMDSLKEMHDLTAVSGAWLDKNGLPTKQGRVMLPLFGIRPTRTGRAPGYLGATTELDPKDNFTVRVTRIEPGSPADLAGLRVGDGIFTIDHQQPFHPSEAERIVRFAGAGSGVEIMLDRQASTGGMTVLKATLGAVSGDAWSSIDHYDMAATVFEQVGMTDAAKTVRALGLFARLLKTPAAQTAVLQFFISTDTTDTLERVQEARRQNTMTQYQAERVMFHAIIEKAERAFGLAPGRLVRLFDGALARGATPRQAFTEAYTQLDKAAEPQIKEALRTLLRRHDEIVLPVSEVEDRFEARPMVRPRFTGIDAKSLLARAILEADYLGKSLLFQPELAKRIPAYRTEYAYDAAHLRAAAPVTRDRHMWISVDGVDLAQSADGGTLVTRGARMRFNIRELRNGHEVPGRESGYAELLTSLYDEFAAVYPVLHEIREAAKLAAAARWMKAKAPDFALPADGRPEWTPPSELPGLINLVWSPKNVRVVMVAPGGVSLRVPDLGPTGPKVPLLPYPGAGGSPDLPRADLDRPIVSEVFVNDTLARALHRKIEVPVPRPLGAVARATKGERVALSLRVPAPGAACNPSEVIGLTRDLERARRLADELRAAERAINLLTANNPARQVAFEEIETDLTAARREFANASYDLATEQLGDLFDEIAQRRPELTVESIKDGAELLKEARKTVATFAADLGRLRETLALPPEEGAGPGELTPGAMGQLFKDLETAADALASAPAAEPIRTSMKALETISKLKPLLEYGHSLWELGHGAWQLRRLDHESDREREALREKLLPLQRRLSDQLDAALQAPSVQRWVAGRQKLDCAAPASAATALPGSMR